MNEHILETIKDRKNLIELKELNKNNSQKSDSLPSEISEIDSLQLYADNALNHFRQEIDMELPYKFSM